MKKGIYLLSVFLMLIICVNSYPQAIIEWTARYNGLLDSTDIANDITVDNSGNTYITGYSNTLLGLLTGAVTISYDPDGNQRWRSEYNGLLNDAGTVITLDNTQQYIYVAGFTNGLLNLTAADYLIIKYRASDGQQIWVNTYNYGILGDDKATGIAIDNLNNPVITGYSQGFLLLLTPYDYATIKYDQNGNQLWVNRFNGSAGNNDSAAGIAVDNTNNVIVTGQSRQTGSNFDYATVKYSPNGVQQWVSLYNGTGNNEDRAYAIVVDNSDNVIVTGSSMSTGSAGSENYATVKYNPSGNQQWVSFYNGTGNNEDRAYAIVVDNSDNVIVTGSSRSLTSNDYSTVKYNPSGSQLWASRYDGPGSNEDRAYAIVVDNSDNVFVTGSSRQTQFAGSEDYATLKYNNSGTEIWVTRYNGSGSSEDRAYAIVVDNSDNIYVTGTSMNGTLPGSEDYLSIKYSSNDIVNIHPVNSEIPSKYNLYQNYPNPFNPETFIGFDLPVNSHVTLKIYNSLGVEVSTLVNETKLSGKYMLRWSAENYPSGIYFYKLQAESSQQNDFGSYTQSKKLLLLK